MGTLEEAEARHYSLDGRLKGVMTTEVSVRGAPGRALTALEVSMRKGLVSVPHAHIHEQMIYVIHDRVRITLPGRPHIDVGAGEFIHIPPNVPHGTEALEDTLELDVFAPARNEILT